MDLPWRRPCEEAPKQDACFWHDTFGICRFGRQCRRVHLSNVCEQEFFAGRVIDVAAREISVEKNLDGKKITIRFHDRSKNDAKKYDVVIFQGSSKKLDSKRFGKVLAILGQNVPFEENILIAPLQTDAFTIDTPGVRYRDQAISIDSCRIHDMCKQIGIHVSAAGLGNFGKVHGLPRYGSYSSEFRKPGWSMDEGNVVLSVSVYRHTKADGTSDPVLTPVKVEQNYTFDDRKKYQSRMDILWLHFVRDSIKGGLNIRDQYYILDSEEVWKELFLLDQMTTTFNTTVTKFVALHPNQFFITKLLPTAHEKCLINERITVFKDYFTCVKSAMAQTLEDVDEKLLRLLKAGESSQIRIPSNFENCQPFKYQRDVENAFLFKDSVVQSSSPLRNIHHFVNQQVLIRCMFGLTENLYESEDLLGILCIRFRTPILARPRITEVAKQALKLSYSQDIRFGGRLYEVDPELLTTIAAQHSFFEGTWEMLFERVSCPSKDLCNRPLAHFDRQRFADIEEKMTEGLANLDQLKGVLQELSEHMTEEESPYRNIESGTILTLQRGVELQLQISSEDANEHNDLSFRLLRVGKNCHLCLTHINNPEKAFMSDRKDVRDLLKMDHIVANKKKIMHGSLCFRNIKVTWEGDYFSGGNFELKSQPSERVASVGDLLCIRREVYKDNQVQYIWACHAIVSEVVCGSVKFAVCTLSQTENQQITEHDFSVEIIKISLKDESTYTDERELD